MSTVIVNRAVSPVLSIKLPDAMEGGSDDSVTLGQFDSDDQQAILRVRYLGRDSGGVYVTPQGLRDLADALEEALA